MKAITARQVHTARPGRHRVQGTPGLFVIVRPSGARSWQYRGTRRDGGPEVQRGLGRVCDVPLSDARAAATLARAALLKGEEPARVRTGRPTAPVHTWADAWAHFADTSDAKANTMDAYRSTWRVHVEPAFGAADISRTTRQDVIDFIRSRKGSVPMKVRKLMAQIAGCAVALGWIAVSPADSAIRNALPAAARQTTTGRRRAMPHAEIAAFLASLPETTAGGALRMLAQTGVRLSDVLGAEWSEVNGDTWIVPGRPTHEER